MHGISYAQGELYRALVERGSNASSVQPFPPPATAASTRSLWRQSGRDSFAGHARGTFEKCNREWAHSYRIPFSWDRAYLVEPEHTCSL